MIRRNTTILVVDDFESMRTVTTTQLRSLWLDRIVAAVNGAEALRILRTQRIDVILSD
ncbi:MAG: response regulator [Rhodocyclaceae bacterium]